MATQSVDPMLEYITQSLGAQDARDQTRVQVQSAIDTIAETTKDEVAGIRAYADSSIAINNITSGFIADTDARKAATFTAWNSDPKQAGNVLEEYAHKMRSAYLETDRLGDEIQNLKGKDFFSDPLGYVTAQFMLPAKVAEFNKFAGQYNRAEAAHNETVSATTATGQMAKVMEQGTSLALVDANAKQILAKAATDIAKVERSGAVINIGGYRDLQQLTEAQLSAAGHAMSVDINLKHYQLQLNNATALEGQREILNLQREAALDSKTQTKVDQQRDLDYYNTGADKLGAPRIGDYNVLRQYLRSKDGTANTLMNIGIEASIKGTTQGIQIAPNAGTAARVLLNSKANPPADANSPYTLLATAYNDSRTAHPEVKDPAVLDSIVHTVATQRAQMQLNGISVDAPNIYKAPSITSISKAISKDAIPNRFIQENILPLGGGRTDLPADPDVILGAAKAVLVAEPHRLNEVAEGISNFFITAVEVNNKTRDYASLVLPPQLAYMAKLKTGNLFGTSTADMTKDVDVKRVLMNYVRSPMSPLGSDVLETSRYLRQGNQ